MATIKVKFRNSRVEGKEGVIYYQVIHERVVRQIRTQLKVFPSEWSEAYDRVILPTSGGQRMSYILAVQDSIKLDLSRLKQTIKWFDRSPSYTSDDIVKSYESRGNGINLFEFMQDIISRLVELGKYRTSETYITTLNSFMRFRHGRNILLSDISSDLMMDYEVYLKMKGVINNTISFYMRVLRAVYNRAVEQDIVQQAFPFRKVYTGIDKTIKRALPLTKLKSIKTMNLESDKDLAFARDMFLFSFYTRGMSFVDMAYLRKKDLNNGVVSYRRRKTGQQLHIKWEQCMQEILERYPAFDSDYLLPIITRKDRCDRSQYRSSLSHVNTKLKKIGEMIDLAIPLTQYVARHSWASVARSSNIPIAVISEGLGHDSEATTQIYLASLDTSIVDKANGLILKLL